MHIYALMNFSIISHFQMILSEILCVRIGFSIETKMHRIDFHFESNIIRLKLH